MKRLSDPPARSASTSRALEDALAVIAAKQHGVLTLQQAGAAGLSRCMVQRRLASGRLRLLHRGVYLALPFPLPHTRDMAAVLASGPGALLALVSAASLWERRAAAATPVDVAVKGHRGRRPGIRAHRLEDLREDEATVEEGIPVTTPGRTLLDVARVLGFRDLETAVARAEREGLVKLEALSVLVARHARHPGAPALRKILAQAGGPALTRSEAERLFLALVSEAHLPRPECNVVVGHYEVDFLWRAAHLAVEVDGFRYHSSHRSFDDDRRKDAQLVAAGITVIRLSWRHITEERMQTAILLHDALARAAKSRKATR